MKVYWRLEILKRLEIIKSAIAIEDIEIIELQIAKLSTMALDSEAAQILSLLEQKEFTGVIELIENYKNSKTGLVAYEDKELLELRMQLKALESELTELSQLKEEYIRILNEFNYEYNKRLGGLIREILRIRREKLEKALESDESLKEEYEKAKEEEASFEYEFKEVIESETKELNEDEKELLKSLYRQASKLCHPDKVEESQRERATKIFQSLNDAYQKNDIDKVREILEAIESGESFSDASDKITNKELLIKRINSIKNEIATLKAEISEIEADEAFKLASTIKDRDAYFDELKEKLEAELNILKGLI